MISISNFFLSLRIKLVRKVVTLVTWKWILGQQFIGINVMTNLAKDADQPPLPEWRSQSPLGILEI